MDIYHCYYSKRLWISLCSALLKAWFGSNTSGSGGVKWQSHNTYA